MSYQIKSTPYFRRMFNNSKKNGQLQRLREEYERIQEFNDRTIELKMRQVRLKRLFREIDELKEGSVSGNGAVGGTPSPASVGHNTRRRQQQQQANGHHHHRYHHQNLLSAGITPEQRRHHQRAEALIRSRELGKELSRRNAQMAEAGVGGGYLRPDLRTSAKMRAVADFRRDAQERRERAAKRISYGNNQSRQNLQRQLKVCRRRQMAAKYQPAQAQELSPNEFRPDYRSVTPSQLDMMVDEEEMAEEQQRYFREQEEDELQLAEERFRRQEKRLRLVVAGSSITSEEEDGQEELRFLRGEQALSEELEDEDDEVHHEKVLELRRRRHNLKGPAQERFLGDRKYNLTLAEEHFRLVTGYSGEERQVDREEDDGDEAPQQADGTEAKEQWGRQLRESTSLLPLRRFSLSSTAIDTAPSAVSHHHHHHHPHQYQGYHPVSVAGAYSSDQDMRTAPLANEELMTSIVPPCSVKCPTASETEDVPALNNWRRVSLMMPWFKVFSPRQNLSERSLDGTLQELPLREGGTAELFEPSMIGDNL